jgi:hypothetical protein
VAPEITFPGSSWFMWLPPVPFCPSTRLQDLLRRDLLNTVVVHCRQNMFQPAEINQMERELCTHLEYNLHVTQEQLAVLESYLQAQRLTCVSNTAPA